MEAEPEVPRPMISETILQPQEHTDLVHAYADGVSPARTPEQMLTDIRRALVTIGSVAQAAAQEHTHVKHLTTVLVQLLKNTVPQQSALEKKNGKPVQLWLFAPKKMLPANQNGHLNIQVKTDRVEACWIEEGVQIVRPPLHLPLDFGKGRNGKSR
jgi:hypothetical protein